jgi:hypothetical protein
LKRPRAKASTSFQNKQRFRSWFLLNIQVGYAKLVMPDTFNKALLALVPCSLGNTYIKRMDYSYFSNGQGAKASTSFQNKQSFRG